MRVVKRQLQCYLLWKHWLLRITQPRVFKGSLEKGNNSLGGRFNCGRPHPLRSLEGKIKIKEKISVD